MPLPFRLHPSYRVSSSGSLGELPVVYGVEPSPLRLREHMPRMRARGLTRDTLDAMRLMLQASDAMHGGKV